MTLGDQRDDLVPHGANFRLDATRVRLNLGANARRIPIRIPPRPALACIARTAFSLRAALIGAVVRTESITDLRRSDPAIISHLTLPTSDRNGPERLQSIFLFEKPARDTVIVPLCPRPLHQHNLLKADRARSATRPCFNGELSIEPLVPPYRLRQIMCDASSVRMLGVDEDVALEPGRDGRHE